MNRLHGQNQQGKAIKAFEGADGACATAARSRLRPQEQLHAVAPTVSPSKAPCLRATQGVVGQVRANVLKLYPPILSVVLCVRICTGLLLLTVMSTPSARALLY